MTEKAEPNALNVPCAVQISLARLASSGGKLYSASDRIGFHHDVREYIGGVLQGFAGQIGFPRLLDMLETQIEQPNRAWITTDLSTLICVGKSGWFREPEAPLLTPLFLWLA